jgi:pimeloyl-ACP methyl ester carboxylesterase
MSERAPHRTIRVNDSELAFVSQGDGDAVVFVHGSVNDYRSWRNQMPPFAERYRTVAYSRRYHWPNPPPGEGTDYAIDRHVADLGDVIENLDLAPARLVGSSYGAMTALTTAISRPDLVHSLVLGEPPLMPWLATLPEGAPLLDAFLTGAFGPAQQAFARGEPEVGVRTFIDGVIGPGAFDRMPPPAREVMLDNAAEMRVETKTPPETYFARITPDDVRGLSAPVLLLEGEHSPRMFGVITDELARVLPAAERVTIPGASHGMHGQQPDAYNDVVLAFQANY